MDKLENGILCNMWNNILQRFHKTSTALQGVDLELCNAVSLVSSLGYYLASLREDFDKFESDAKNMSPSLSQDYKVDTQRHRKRKKQADESSEPDYVRSGGKKFKTAVFIAVIDRLVAELDRRYHSYKGIQQTFGFLNEIPSIPLQDLHIGAANLQKKYAGDLEEDFVDEIGQFRQF